MGNPDRCAEAGLPDDISFETRPQQVIDMIDSAIEAKVPFAWCAADEEFGQNPGLCDHLHAAGINYVQQCLKPVDAKSRDEAPGGRTFPMSCQVPQARPAWQRRSERYARAHGSCSGRIGKVAADDDGVAVG